MYKLNLNCQEKIKLTEDGYVTMQWLQVIYLFGNEFLYSCFDYVPFIPEICMEEKDVEKVPLASERQL